MSRAVAIITVLLLLLVHASPTLAARADWSPEDLEQQLMCLPCNQRLDQSESAFAQGLRQQIRQFHDRGWSEQRVKDYFIAQYGNAILAAPPARGFDLLAWVVPAAVLAGGAAVAAAIALAWHRGGRGGAGGGPSTAIDPAVAARIDRDLTELE